MSDGKEDSYLLRAAAQVDRADGQESPKTTTTKPSGSLVDSKVHEQRIKKLNFLLQRSGVYSRIMGEKMDKERKARAQHAAKQEKKQVQKPKAPSIGRSTRARDAQEKAAAATNTEPTSKANRKDSRKRKLQEDYSFSIYFDQEDLVEAEEQAKKQKTNDGKAATANGKHQDEQEEQEGRRSQPKLVTGAQMREYQLDGLEWLISLYENGLNGILADEMGLGKTLQTISFLAHLREKGVCGPFLIVAPLSTIHNWLLEFKRFTPDIPAIMYHGTADERKEMRNTHLRIPTIKSERLLFPVVVTSYEVVVRDRSHLAGHPWKFIVVDEGHRLKNMNCKLIRELKTYPSANRLILTGTPLHNNLAELWSLLNFILPDIFDDLVTFEAWFNFSHIHDEEGSNRILSKETSGSIITQLHDILKPFLLRRLKADVESNLPPKKEYLLYAPLTPLQKDLYDSVVNKDIRKWLMQRKTGMEWDEIQEVLDDPEGTAASSQPPPKKGKLAALLASSGQVTPAKLSAATSIYTDSDVGSETSTSRRSTRRSKNLGYALNDQEGDTAYFNRLETESDHAPPLTPNQAERQGKLYSIKQAQKSINNMHLENQVMQARKICNHPFLFDWPIDPDTGSFVVNKDLINASGKMLMLNRLLDELFRRGHKVLVFSQFTTMLDIIQDWAAEYKGFRTCRIDGNTSQVDRREQMRSFNEDTGVNACNLFLLSTRAGGLGINLVSADTVIFFDSDWNPQMDLQAQDRVHRIGQAKPCLILRLVAANTVEERILKRAGNKRKLEALVIQQGKFKLPTTQGKSNKKKEDEMNEIMYQLLRLEGEQVQLVAGEHDEIISHENLEKLLDRSKEAYERRTGWLNESKAFQVTETVADQANEEIAKMLSDN